MQLFCKKKTFFFKKSKIFALRDRCFFDLSDHEIVGGCSTLLAKSNKKNTFFATKVLCISKKCCTFAAFFANIDTN